MREKRYDKDMKGTQGKEEENKEEAEKMLKEVFAEKGLKLDRVCANNYKTTFAIKGKFII
nr:MAG: hypothetical protein [Bacteriophage sp.]